MDKTKIMSFVCSVAVCDSPKGVKFSFHRFPKDPDLRRNWVSACRRKDHFDASKGRICCIHFLPSDFKRDLKNELLGLPTIKRLHENAVPTKNLFPTEISKFYEALKMKKATIAGEYTFHFADFESFFENFDDVVCEPDLHTIDGDVTNSTNYVSTNGNLSHQRIGDSGGLVVDTVFEKQDSDYLSAQEDFDMMTSPEERFMAGLVTPDVQFVTSNFDGSSVDNRKRPRDDEEVFPPAKKQFFVRNESEAGNEGTENVNDVSERVTEPTKFRVVTIDAQTQTDPMIESEHLQKIIEDLKKSVHKKNAEIERLNKLMIM